MSFERQATSLERLRIEWQYPVAPPRVGTGTAAAGAMPFAEAMRLLWDSGDLRPLLVMREAAANERPDEDLLQSVFANDRLLLLSKWFRAVRLPAHVVETSHPLHNTFASCQARDCLPRLFLLAYPEAKPVEFTGEETPGDLAKGLCDVIGQRYAKDPQHAVKAWLTVLERFDVLDGRRVEMQDQLDEARATLGPNSAKARKLVESLKENAAARVEAMWEERRARDLGLLQMPGALLAAAPQR